jgi:hypothetical protein
MTGSSGDFIVMASGEKKLDKVQNKYDEATYQSLVLLQMGRQLLITQKI